ncbi:unnamed protein product [Periconia digitata]|uniref:Ent-kaurene oxidase n=1 Tax=Periconia digitata TaxID=1303443 RepID=A0A9W4UP61_9PLEO|nr:unnamed protein product [Periconia digitata]
MEFQVLGNAAHTLQTVAVATLFFGIVFFFPKLMYYGKISKLPALDSQKSYFISSARKIYAEGYQKYKDSVYRVKTNDDETHVVLPPLFLAEVRKLPDTVLSFPKAVENLMETRYTQIITESQMMSHSIKADLTPNLSRLNSVVFEEVQQAVSEDIPACEDWTSINIYFTLVHMVAKITGRLFVGPDLCRHKDYIDSAINYTMDVIAVQQGAKKINPWLRPILAPRLPEYKRLRQREKDAEALLEPIIEARRVAEANDPDYQRPDDMLAWFMARSKDYRYHSNLELAKLQLGLIFAAIHTTTLTATNILYTLASQPEYMKPLREEIRTVMAKNGGTITTRALQQMIKLDSYMKEVVRFDPISITSFNRKVLRGFTLSNGQYIPAGVTVVIPTHEIYNDPANFSMEATDPKEFDGFRYSKIRENGNATDHARNQFVTANDQSTMFGYGRHACPGRFFAANEIKMILARLILDYDIKNEGDHVGRYPNHEYGGSVSVDATKNLLLKKVEV